MTTTNRVPVLSLAFAALSLIGTGAASAQDVLAAMGSPPNPKVAVSWS